MVISTGTRPFPVDDEQGVGEAQGLLVRFRKPVLNMMNACPGTSTSACRCRCSRARPGSRIESRRSPPLFAPGVAGYGHSPRPGFLGELLEGARGSTMYDRTVYAEGRVERPGIHQGRVQVRIGVHVRLDHAAASRPPAGALGRQECPILIFWSRSWACRFIERDREAPFHVFASPAM